MLSLPSVLAQGYDIKVTVEGTKDTTAILGYYMLDKQYLLDTVHSQNGVFHFQGEEPLNQGHYLVVFPPDNTYFPLMINDDQQFEVQTSEDDYTVSMKVKGSKQNTNYYKYVQYLATLRPQADSLRAILADSTLSKEKQDKTAKALDKLDESVQKLQNGYIKKDPKGSFALLLKSTMEPDIPEFEGSDEEIQQKRYRYYRSHYFDNLGLDNERALRSNYLAKKLDNYLDKMIPQIPDTINQEIDMMLQKMEPQQETWKYYLSRFFNKYANSKIVGMDAVYVHLADKYYATGKADWVDSVTVQKIVDNAERLKPILIGKKAPDIELTKRDGGKVKLHDIQSPYTVLFFFDPECSHCKKQTPVAIEFAKKFVDKGVKVVTVCSKVAPNQKECWNYNDEKEGMNKYMLNTIDPYNRSRFRRKYDIFAFPQIFVLDENKKILSKRIGATQLEDVLTRLIDMKERQALEKAKDR